MVKTKKPLVCIIILNYNGEKIIFDCLNSLKKTNYPNYKIIVIDNGSSDKSRKIISKFKEVELICLEKNIGYAPAINVGWNYCLKKYSPDYICDVNSDVRIIQKEWLSLMVDELEKEKKGGICSNKTLHSENVLETQHFDNKKTYTQEDKGQYDFVSEVETVGGTIMLVKANMIKKIGGLDENFFFGPDDIDYCRRARKAKFKIIWDGFSKAIHLGSFTGRASNKDFIYQHQSKGLMLLSFRYDKNIDKIKNSLTQFIRIFMTKKNPYKGNNFSNIYFHKRFFPRTIIFIKSFMSAIRNYKVIKQHLFKHGSK